ncbi:MAG: hypothetical protein ABSB84_10305 [Verrucomicrobiota bacterium]
MAELDKFQFQHWALSLIDARPLKPLPVGSFTIEQKKIAAALALGHDEALQQMATTDAEPLGGSVSD